MRTIDIPAGRCPVKLLGETSADVINWAGAVRDHGLRDSIIYKDSAVRYFLRQFTDGVKTPLYRELLCHLESEDVQFSSAV